MKITDKKQCPKCGSKEIFDTGNRGPECGDTGSVGRHSMPSGPPIYRCRECKRSFIYKGED